MKDFRLHEVKTGMNDRNIHLFQRRLLSRHGSVCKDANGLSDVLLQTVLGLLKAVPGQSLGLGVGLGVGLRRSLGQGQRGGALVRSVALGSGLRG